LPARGLEAVGSAVQELDPAAVDSLQETAEGLDSDADRRFLRFLASARTEADPVAAGAKLLEGFWESGIEELLRSRCEAIAR